LFSELLIAAQTKKGVQAVVLAARLDRLTRYVKELTDYNIDPSCLARS
jgi:DNA invertase Pin-like site-specific DNA recombinase